MKLDILSLLVLDIGMAVPRAIQQLSQFSQLIVNDPANRAWALSNFVRVAHPFVGVIIPDDWEWLTDLARHEIQAANNGVVPEPFEDDEKYLVKEALDSIINAIGLWFQHRSQEPHPGAPRPAG